MSTLPLDSKWDELFRAKADVITEYSKTHTIHLINTEIKQHDLSKSHLGTRQKIIIQFRVAFNQLNLLKFTYHS